MSKRDKPIFTVVTPFDVTRPFTLFEDVWEEHIVEGHPEMEGQQGNVQLILQEPTIIFEGTTNETHIAFLNSAIVSPHGSPMTVFVNPSEQIVVTAGYRRDFKDLSSRKILWSPSGTKPTRRRR